MWWRPLTNQNLVWRCAEVHGGALLYVLGYHWLPLATIDLVDDNRKFEVLRHILSCYTYFYSTFGIF